MTRGIYQTYVSSNELYHHGILGQKWGVRRYQNPDGTYTNIGKKRLRNEKRANKQELKDIRSELNSLYKRYDELDDEYTYGKNADVSKNAKIDEEYSSINKRINELKAREKELDKGKIAKGLAIAGGVAAAGLLAYTGYKNRDAIINALKDKNFKTKLINTLRDPDLRGPVNNFVKNIGKKTISTISSTTKDAGKAMLTAAMVSVGTIEIANIASKLDTSDNVSESVRNRNQIIKDAATAGITSVTGAKDGKSSNSNNKKGNGNAASGTQISSVVGAPPHKQNPLPKQGEEYNNLFKDSNGRDYDGDTRATVKKMISDGYTYDQAREYCKLYGTLKHSSMYKINFICHRAY